jgi:hypothetical protein
MIFDMKFTSQLDMLFAYWNMGLSSTDHALKTKAVQDFIRNDKSKFDLILAEQFFQEAFLMFAHKYKAPIVTISEFIWRLIAGPKSEHQVLLQALTDIPISWTVSWAL